MTQKIKTLAIALSMLFAFSAPVALSVGVASAVNVQGSVCQGANGLSIPVDSNGNPIDPTAGTCKTTTNGGATSLNTIISDIINIFSVIVGVVAVIMIIVGGFRYVTSGGKDESVKTAKNTILYALIGLVIVALAQIIVKFVLNKATQ